MLSEVLPLTRVLHATTVRRRQVQATAQRLENELGDERSGFVTGSPAEWAELPRPDLPLVVGLDGGYVHSCTQRTRRDGWFRGDRWQDHARRRAVIVFRVSAATPHQR
jgi:hypothetical protein